MIGRAWRAWRAWRAGVTLTRQEAGEIAQLLGILRRAGGLNRYGEQVLERALARLGPEGD